jgi:H/ACA ribonucleoprotein complex subunit 4
VKSQQGAGKEYVSVLRLHDAIESEKKLAQVCIALEAYLWKNSVLRY